MTSGYTSGKEGKGIGPFKISVIAMTSQELHIPQRLRLMDMVMIRESSEESLVVVCFNEKRQRRQAKPI